MDLEREVKRLRNRATGLTVAVVAGVALYGWSIFGQIANRLLVYPSVDGGWGTSGDGPFVITHLIAYGPGEGERRWAPLSEPMVVMDSDGGTIDLSNLQWRDVRNKRATAPTSDRIVAVYFRPNLTKQK